ncbi:hypothetical protein F2Q69_00023226 [Brassica cretica]|uniref:Uncharacterized protein n=1 Tax=Brassica cretica TaxID=69181 RepID=A0A8S9Q363_BRACR|nr:hypothetical protein F2Q69_00023226 [Brassica cretica]
MYLFLKRTSWKKVVEISNGSNRPLILGRAFLATVGAVTDMPNKRISFVKIDENVFYRAEPTNKCTRLASSISVLDQSTHVPISKEDLMEKVPNKKSVMANLGHSKLWVESGMVAKLKVKYMEVTGAGVQN